nr:hypothetical protein [Tanacetum cinerariifolium]
IVAGEGIPYEPSPATFPRRQVAGKRNPQRQVTGESPRLSLGKAVNVVVKGEENELEKLTTSSSRYRITRPLQEPKIQVLCYIPIRDGVHRTENWYCHAPITLFRGFVLKLRDDDGDRGRNERISCDVLSDITIYVNSVTFALHKTYAKYLAYGIQLFPKAVVDESAAAARKFYDMQSTSKVFDEMSEREKELRK